MKEEKPKESGGTVTGVGKLSKPTYVENLFAPEVYADESSFFGLKNGNISISFSSARYDNTSDPGVLHRVNVGRLVMPISSARSLAEGLFDYMKKNGLIPDKGNSN